MHEASTSRARGTPLFSALSFLLLATWNDSILQPQMRCVGGILAAAAAATALENIPMNTASIRVSRGSEQCLYDWGIHVTVCVTLVGRRLQQSTVLEQGTCRLSTAVQMIPGIGSLPSDCQRLTPYSGTDRGRTFFNVVVSTVHVPSTAVGHHASGEVRGWG